MFKNRLVHVTDQRYLVPAYNGNAEFEINFNVYNGKIAYYVKPGDTALIPDEEWGKIKLDEDTIFILGTDQEVLFTIKIADIRGLVKPFLGRLAIMHNGIAIYLSTDESAEV